MFRCLPVARRTDFQVASPGGAHKPLKGWRCRREAQGAAVSMLARSQASSTTSVHTRNANRSSPST